MVIDTRDLLSAYRINPDGKTEYVVVAAIGHHSLEIGDVVIATVTPDQENAFVRKRDFSIHSMRSDDGYVLLVPHTPDKK